MLKPETSASPIISADEVAAGVVRLARLGATQLMMYPVAPEGRIEQTIERFQAEVMPRVRAAGQ